MEVWLFIVQRLTAMVLGPLVIVHLATMIYAIQGGLSAAEIMGRTQGSLIWGLVYGLFVTAAALHGALGLRQIAREAFQWRGVTQVQGSMRGRQVSFIDSSGNGIFDDPGVDTVIVGAGKDARVDPYGRYVFLEEDNGWFPFEIKMATRNASVIRTRPYRGDLARIQLVYKGGKRPEYLIVQGTGEDAAFFFERDNRMRVTVPNWLKKVFICGS